jgi:MurNAc alpha-1-phosphate uridylyltransferase
VDAFILAAGLGTRLRPLTDHGPKALVPVAGVPMLERVARRLIEAGADRLVVNVHHHAPRIVEFLQRSQGFGVPWAVSHEVEQPLDTGGALRYARDLLRRDAPFYLHNVDVLTTFPLADMYAAHRASGALATLAISARSSRRGLIFDESGLCGRFDGDEVASVTRHAEGSAPRPGPRGRFPFGGVHVIDPDLLDRISEPGAFSVLDLYLRLVREGAFVAGYRIDGYPWFDLGTPEKLAAAEVALAGA